MMDQHEEELKMASIRGEQLAQEIRQKVADLKKVCEGADEATASRAPEGRWSPKEILSHLCGREENGHLPLLRAFVEQDNPTIDLEVENPFFSEKRASMSFQQLLQEVEREYEGLSRFTAELSDEQLSRKALIPKLKDSPLGDNPTLDAFIHGLGDYHVQFHTDHMREVLQALRQ
jgi:hypothetical protein